MNKNIRNIVLFLLIGLMILVFSWYRPEKPEAKVIEISYSDFLNMLEPTEGKKPIGKIHTADGKIKKQLTVEKDIIEGWYIPEDSEDKKPRSFKTMVAPLNTEVVTKLRKSNVSFQAKTTEETIAQFEVEKAELTTKLADYEVQLQEMASLREYKVAIETQTKKDYIAKVENLEDFEKEAILVDVDKYSFAQLEEEVAKLVGKKVLKFSAEVSKPISDTNSKYTHDDKTQPVRAYEANWIKN